MLSNGILVVKEDLSEENFAKLCQSSILEDQEI